MNTGRRRRDDGSTPAYLDNGGGTGCPGSRLSNSFSFLAGLEVSDALRRHVHPIAGPEVAAPVRPAVPETETAKPGPTDPSRPTRGSSGDSPRSVSTTPPSRRPVPGSTSATSSSPIRASVRRSLVVDVVNIAERRAAPANHQGVRFSVATNGKFTVVTNSCHVGSEYCWVLQYGAMYEQDWPRSLRAYAFPRIGPLPVSDVTTPMCGQS